MSTEDTAALLQRIAEALERLAPTAPESPDFSAAKLFRHDAAQRRFVPAPDYGLSLDLLVGVDRQKERFVENLERFAAGFPANHVLLWGTRGGGKSSLAKAAFMAMSEKAPALRMIEVDRDEIDVLPRLFETLRRSPERFVVLCDDLSFEEGPGGLTAQAKSLKSALEGGVLGPPENVLFVATSNRRHLMPRGHDEAGRGLIAAAEDAEEEISVSDRFGLWLGFPPMDQPGYLAAVRSYAKTLKLKTTDIDRKALQWAQRRGGRSGRVAWQFIRDLAAEQGKKLPY